MMLIFQTEQFMKFPEALLHYSTNSYLKRGLTLIHALHSSVSTVQRKIQRVPFRTCEATTVTPKELYFSLDRSVLRYLPSQKISLYSLHSSQQKHEKEIHRNCNCHESHMFKYRLVQLISSTLCHKDMP